MKTKLFFYSALVFLLGSCATLNISEINSPSNKEFIDALKLRMSMEVYDLRIDLKRETTTQTISAANGGVSTQTVNVPYHPLGVYLCDGVFLDLNNNLSINVIDLIDPSFQKDFVVKQKRKYRPNAPFEYKVTRKGNKVNLEYRSFFGKGVSIIHFLDSLITIDNPGISNNENILIKKDRLRYYRKGVFGMNSKAEIVKTKQGFMVPRFGKDTEYKQTQKNLITLGKFTTVKNHGDKIEFIYEGLLGTEVIYTLLKLKDGYIFHDKKNRGLRIKLDGNKVIVEENGKLKELYEYGLGS